MWIVETETPPKLLLRLRFFLFKVQKFSLTLFNNAATNAEIYDFKSGHEEQHFYYSFNYLGHDMSYDCDYEAHNYTSRFQFVCVVMKRTHAILYCNGSSSIIT